MGNLDIYEVCVDRYLLVKKTKLPDYLYPQKPEFEIYYSMPMYGSNSYWLFTKFYPH